jgi:hypothetical protein
MFAQYGGKIYYTKTLCHTPERHNVNLYHCENYVFVRVIRLSNQWSWGLFFGDVTLCHWVIGSQHFKVMQWSHSQGSKHQTRMYMYSWTFGLLKMRPLHHPETSEINCPVMQHHIPEERTHHILYLHSFVTLTYCCL